MLFLLSKADTSNSQIFTAMRHVVLNLDNTNINNLRQDNNVLNKSLLILQNVFIEFIAHVMYNL